MKKRKQKKTFQLFDSGQSGRFRSIESGRSGRSGRRGGKCAASINQFQFQIRHWNSATWTVSIQSDFNRNRQQQRDFVFHLPQIKDRIVPDSSRIRPGFVPDSSRIRPRSADEAPANFPLLERRAERPAAPYLEHTRRPTTRNIPVDLKLHLSNRLIKQPIISSHAAPGMIVNYHLTIHFF